MKSFSLGLVAVACLSIAGCAGPVQTRQIPLTAPYDAVHAKQLLQPGTNSLKGSALLRQQGGGVVTCAGRPVYLIPATAYAIERTEKLYGSSAPKRYLPFQRPPTFTPDEPDYLKNVKEATCDAQGFFTFDRVADGTFFVNTSVQWVVNNVEQGGYLLQRVTLQNSEPQTIVLTH